MSSAFLELIRPTHSLQGCVAQLVSCLTAVRARGCKFDSAPMNPGSFGLVDLAWVVSAKIWGESIQLIMVGCFSCESFRSRGVGAGRASTFTKFCKLLHEF